MTSGRRAVTRLTASGCLDAHASEGKGAWSAPLRKSRKTPTRAAVGPFPPWSDIHMDDTVAVSTDPANSGRGPCDLDNTRVGDARNPDIGGEAVAVHRPLATSRPVRGCQYRPHARLRPYMTENSEKLLRHASVRDPRGLGLIVIRPGMRNAAFPEFERPDRANRTFVGDATAQDCGSRHGEKEFFQDFSPGVLRTSTIIDRASMSLRMPW